MHDKSATSLLVLIMKSPQCSVSQHPRPAAAEALRLKPISVVLIWLRGSQVLPFLTFQFFMLIVLWQWPELY
jgi:hypothetical protein